MKDLKELTQECMVEMKSIHIPIGDIEDISYARMRGAFAKCLLDVSGHYHIRIADSFQRGKYDLEELKSTICHELLHTCAGCMGQDGEHNARWRSYAKRADEAYGYGIMEWKSSYDACHKDRPTLHRLRCKSCGSIWNMKEKRAWEEYLECVQEGDAITCAWCENGYEIIF